MSPRNWRVRIHDILNAIKAIESYAKGMVVFEDFASDQKTVDAVIRNLVIIGEAATNVPEEIILDHPSIPWQEMKGIRNIVVHEYFGVSTRIIRDTVRIDLPPVIPLLEKILEYK